MGLTKYKLGELIEQSDIRNSANELSVNDVRGISTGKEFIETKANMDGVSTLSYKIVHEDEFAYVADTSRRGEKIALAYNSTTDRILISSIYTVFYVKRKDLILSEYLFMYFKRPEFDRFSRFNSWGSARETFDWDEFCDIEIKLPPLEVQQKYVDVYDAMLSNHQSYECGLENLKLVCDAYIEDLRREIPIEAIGPYIKSVEIKNENEKYGVDRIKGISNKKEFVETKANTSDLSTKKYNIVPEYCFAFNPNTARMGDQFCIALNKKMDDILVSAIYPVFCVSNVNKLIPEYLMMFFGRDQFDRYVRFNSWGSARETFNYSDIENVEIPIPSIDIQESIISIFNCYIERKEINEKLKEQIKNMCPILIKGSIEEGRTTKG